VAYHLAGGRRKIALNNLHDALQPGADEATQERIARDCFKHFGRLITDTIWLFPRKREQLDRLIKVRGQENIQKAYDSGRGVLLFSGHFGHWELVALYQGYLGMPLGLVTRPIDNPAVEHFLADLRCRSGNEIIHKKNATRRVVRRLREGGGVAIVIDQDQGDGAIFVPFFGRPASTTPTVASLALKTGAAIIPTYSLPVPGGGYEIIYGPEVTLDSLPDGECRVTALTAKCTAILEGWIRERPECWLWMHRRWKSTPRER
jgi:KDO2-lipid IV(A) lauroyltransferase